MHPIATRSRSILIGQQRNIRFWGVPAMFLWDNNAGRHQVDLNHGRYDCAYVIKGRNRQRRFVLAFDGLLGFIGRMCRNAMVCSKLPHKWLTPGTRNKRIEGNKQAHEYARRLDDEREMIALPACIECPTAPSTALEQNVQLQASIRINCKRP